MGTLGQMVGLRREYGMNAWVKGIFTLLGLGMAGGGIFGALKVMPLPDSGLLTAILALLPTFLGIFLLAYAYRSRLIIDGTRITVRGPFSEKSADLGEIEGFRTVSSRNGTYRQIYLKEGRGSITLSNSFSTDDDFKSWFQKVPDLDERDRQTLLDEIAKQQELGATPEERLGALGTAKAVSIALLVVTVLLSVGVIFNNDTSQFLPRFCFALLALAPLVSAWLVRSSPLLYTVFKKKKDPRGDVCWVVFIPGMVFIIRNSDIHFVGMSALVVYMAVIGLAIVALFWSASGNGVRNAWVALLAFAGFYAYGVVIGIDVFFDNSLAAPYSATVLGGHVSHGKSDTDYLRVSPWGLIDHEGDVSVTNGVYRHSHLGDRVCPTLHNGSLHVPWYEVKLCGDQPAPQDSPSDLPQ